jgi:hypothetical protein
MPTRKIPGFDWDLTFIFDFVHLIWLSWNAFCGPWHILALTEMKSDYTNSPFKYSLGDILLVPVNQIMFVYLAT